jgi:DNA repair protein SbcC/Rad50
MQLRRIRVRNVRSYESGDLTLGPGTTLLSGDVGSGKTSLLYAIEMALFGFAEVDPTYLVRHQAAESEVLLALADDEHRYEFGRKFRRRRRKGREVFELESASFSTDGATTSYSVTEIRQRAISLLGFPDNPNPRAHSDLWRWAVYVPQERMREVLGQEPEERLETVRKALGLEQYRTAAENAQLLAAELRRMADRAEAEARGRDHLLEEQPRLQGDLAAHEAEARTAASALERDVADVQASEALLNELEGRRRALERDRGEEDQLVDRARSDEEGVLRHEAHGRELERETARWTARRAESAQLVERRGQLAEALRDLDERLGRARSEREERTRDLANLSAVEARLLTVEEGLHHARAELERAGTEVASSAEDLGRRIQEGPQKEPPAPTPRTIPEIDRALDEARGRAEGLLGEISRLEHIASENDELRSAGVCPRCHQKVDPSEFAAHFQEITDQLAHERAHLASARAERDHLAEERKARERFDRAHQRWSDLEGARRTARERADRAAAQRSSAARRVSELESVRAADLTERDRLRPRAEGAREALDGLARLEAERGQREKEANAIGVQLDEARGAETALLRLTKEREDWATERHHLDEQRAARQEKLREVRERLAALPGLASEVGAARARRDSARDSAARSERTLERARTLVETGQARLASIEGLLVERLERLETATRHRELAGWFGQTFREAVLTLEHRLLARAQAEFEREFSRFFTILVEDPGLIARCDAGFSPAVEIDGEWTPAEALSGGERTALALAFRLALGQVVRAAGRLKLETLILDEPTDGFSPEQVVRMGELLDGLGLPQVLLVSHEAQLTSIADRVVRVEKEGGRSLLRLPLANEGDAAETEPSAGAPSILPRRRVRSPRLDAPESRSASEAPR